MTTQVNLYEAKTHLSDLVERASAGEDIVIAKSGRPKVRLVAVTGPRTPRTPGALRGRVRWYDGALDDVTDDFEGL